MPAKQTKTETAPTTQKTKVAEKSTKTTKAAASTPAPVEPKMEAVAEVQTKPVKAAKKSKPAAEVAAPVSESASEVVAAVAVDVSSVSAEFTSFTAKLQQLSSLISGLKTEFRSLEKKASRELKTAAKASHKRKRKTGNRSPSGFVKPTLISDELAAFLGKDNGTQMARTEVTREINAYIRTNQLQDKTNGRRINADVNLASLLKLKSGEELTYFNLQRYMSPHFAKSAAAAAAAAVAAAAVATA